MEQQEQSYKRIFSSLRQIYENKDKVYVEIRDLLAPGTGLFDCDAELENSHRDYQELLDSEPITYLDTTVAGLYGGLINPASRWFDLTIDKTKRRNRMLDMYTVNTGLEQAREFLYYLFARSNFYSAMRSVLSEWVRYGVGCMLVEERDWDFIFFNPLTIGEYYLGINEKGEYDKLARKLSFTADQMIDRFGEENVPTRVIDTYNSGNFETRFEVFHLICPNTNNGLVPSRFKFVDLYWTADNDKGVFLRASGFVSNPIVVFSWERKNLRTIYPMGIGEKILGDVKELQYTVKCLNVNKSYLANPALALHTSLGRKPVLPGARYYTDQEPSKVAAEIFRVNSHIVELEDSRTRLLDKIRKMSYAELMLLFAQQNKGSMTAREVTAIVNEQMTLLAPVYLQAKEGLNALFKRVIDICIRRGAFPETNGFNPREIGVEFMSSIAKAQRMSELGSLQDLLMYISSLAQVKPGALDYINEDAIVKDIADRLGNSSKINSDDRVAGLRQAQAQAQQEQQRIANMREQMKIAKDASKATLDPASVLGQMVQEQGGTIPQEAYPQPGGNK